MAAHDAMTLRVDIDPDRTTAALIVPAGYPLSALTPDACMAVLQAAEVAIDEQVMQACVELINQVANQQGDGDVRAIVARLHPPVHGEDGRLEWLIEEDKPDAERSHYDRSAFIMVKAGQEIARIIEPTPAMDGSDVLGRTIPARPGKPYDVRHDDTILQNSRGTLIAQVDGAFDRNETMLRIRNILQIADYVDFSTGNIDFSGDVTIGKGVRDCFKVRSGGNVQCDGVIEAATIECLGNLITRGMVGREQGVVAAGGHVVARYLDNVQAHVGLDLRVERSIVNCNTTVFGHIDSPRAAIIGGRHVVTGQIKIDTLGSPAQVMTELVVATVPRLDPFHDRLASLVEQLHQRLARLHQEYSMILATPHPATAQKERLAELCCDITRCTAAMRRGKLTLLSLRQHINQVRTLHVAVSGVLHSGVVVNIAGQAFRIRDDVKGPLSIERDQSGQPVIRCGGAVRGPLGLIAELRAAA
jgi:uncharacterized protein (DUF342 family)